MTAIGKSYEMTILERIRRDDDYARALFAEACSSILEGEPSIGLSMLRDLIHAKITFKRLADETGFGEKTLHKMLGQRGNPTISSLSRILSAIENDLGFSPTVTA